MKKIVAIILAVVMAALCGCAKQEIVPQRGTVENGVYENSSFGVTFAADENWYYYNDEEIASSMGVAADEIYPEDFEGTAVIYDMYCTNLSTGGSVNINYEKAGEGVTEEYYLEITKTQIENQINGTALSLARNTTGLVSVGGKDVLCMYITIDAGDFCVYEAVVAKKVGDWMGVITVAALEEAELKDLFAKLSFE